jgi:hypothetical protein
MWLNSPVRGYATALSSAMLARCLQAGFDSVKGKTNSA